MDFDITAEECRLLIGALSLQERMATKATTDATDLAKKIEEYSNAILDPVKDA